MLQGILTEIVFFGRIILAKISLNTHVLLSISYIASRAYKELWVTGTPGPLIVVPRTVMSIDTHLDYLEYLSRNTNKGQFLDLNPGSLIIFSEKDSRNLCL